MATAPEVGYLPRGGAETLPLSWTDRRGDAAGWAAELGASERACALLLDAHFIDLHCDMDVPVRVWGYDPARHHGVADRVPWYMGHTDFPRLREAGFDGVVYDMPTNPFRRASRRLAVTLENVAAAVARVEAHPEDLALVADRSGYDRARREGRLAVWLSLQGGNAVSADPSALGGPLGERLHRITLVHLTSSDLGGTSSPAGADGGITELGREVVARCNAARILVDLAHAGKRTFWGALEAHAPDLPPIVSHTGVDAVRRHWRNVDDAQIRAIARRGGVVGVMYQSSFLAPGWGTCRRASILDHLQHICELVGDEVAAIGTDYDGMIVPPGDLPDVTHHPHLVDDMLGRAWSERRIRGVLGENYLRVVRSIRP